MKILLPTTLDLRPALPDGVAAVAYDPGAPLPDEHLDAEALVVWGSGRARLEAIARDARRLRWVQSLAAGPDSVLAAGFGPDVALTSGRGLHDAPVAEHALALLLAAARRLHRLRDAQHARVWRDDLGGIQPLRDPGAFRSLIGASIVIWGFGRIGRRLAGYLRAMGAEVAGVARSAGARDGVPVVDEAGADALLPGADALVLVLPSLPSTRRTLDARRLALLPAHAWVVNVGRGDTIDEGALAAALRGGRLGGAALDVFEEEPLPAASPLWGLDDVILTPHAAGGRPYGAEALIEENLRRLLAGTPLLNLVGGGAG
jgi:phosphoglycerate dehydrogenase-like enzyme